MSVYSSDDNVISSHDSTSSRAMVSYVPTPETKDLKSKIKCMKTADKMSEYTLENVELVSTIPTGLLNAWNPIADHKFCKRSGVVKFVRSSSTAYAKTKMVNTRLDELEAKVAELEHVLEQLTAGARRQKQLPEYGSY
jgi:hypothetical protein